MYRLLGTLDAHQLHWSPLWFCSKLQFRSCIVFTWRGLHRGGERGTKGFLCLWLMLVGTRCWEPEPLLSEDIEEGGPSKLVVFPQESIPFLGDEDNVMVRIGGASEIKVQPSISWLGFLLGFELRLFLKKCVGSC